MVRPPSAKLRPVDRLLAIMAALRSPEGCPWDREQDHRSLRYHAVEEVYELMDAIEAGDDGEMQEELGDLLLQVVFHCQLARERGVFDFDGVAARISEKLIRRHPHVFGDVSVKSVDQVWANWEKIKKAEKSGTAHERHSALDGVPKRMPGLMRAQKLLKKAAKAGLAEVASAAKGTRAPRRSREGIAKLLFEIAAECQERGWSAEDLLRGELARREKGWRREERARARSVGPKQGAGRKGFGS